MKTQREKTINDDEGNPHAYMCTQHGGREGVRLLGRVLKVVAGPLGVLAAVAGASTAQPATDAADGDPDAPANPLDPSSIAKALRSSAEALVSEGPDSLIEDILKHTIRDSQPVAKVFDVAFQGNYGELAEAVAFAMTTNFEATFKRVPFGRASALRTLVSTR